MKTINEILTSVKSYFKVPSKENTSQEDTIEYKLVLQKDSSDRLKALAGSNGCEVKDIISEALRLYEHALKFELKGRKVTLQISDKHGTSTSPISKYKVFNENGY